MHPITQQEMMRVEKCHLDKQAERSQQINQLAAQQQRRFSLSPWLDRLGNLLIRLGQALSSPADQSDSYDASRLIRHNQ